MSGNVNPAHVDPEYAKSSMFREVIAHGMWGGALISTVLGTQFPGPLAFDNAVSLIAAKTKGIRSVVAGRADILAVPDLESGNMLARQLEYLADALLAGVAVGASVPIVLSSRTDSADTAPPPALSPCSQPTPSEIARSEGTVDDTLIVVLRRQAGA
jgi:Phosphate acetyl/butaryl transferase/MaoC like domain